jgi:hypothetical protein
MMSSSDKLESPSAERNKDPIWKILQSKVFDKKKKRIVLEVAAGAGVHMEYFVQQLLHQGSSSFRWYPTDPGPATLASLAARIPDNALDVSVVATPLPLTLDANGIMESSTRDLLPSLVDVVLNINMIHISPWSATLGLMKVAGARVRPGGVLFLFGPYRVNGTCVETNLLGLTL